MALALRLLTRNKSTFLCLTLLAIKELMEQQGIDSQTNVISLDKIIVDSKLSEKNWILQ